MLEDDKYLEKTKQIEQSKGDQECSWVGRMGCIFNRVFRIDFLGQETIDQIFEEGEGLAKHEERDFKEEEKGLQ